jgi:hypothetical protein
MKGVQKKSGLTILRLQQRSIRDVDAYNLTRRSSAGLDVLQWFI